MKITQEKLPGIVATILLALISVKISNLFPIFNSESTAIILGIIIGNTLLKNSYWENGINWSEKYIIQFAIALLGLTVSLKTIESLGVQGVFYIVLQMAFTILFVIYIGRKVFKTDQNSALLMASGNAVCGTSAIASVAPVIGANNNDRRLTSATVSITGVFLLFLLPEIGPILFNDDRLVGGLIGGTIQSVGQAIGAGQLVNSDVATFATIFKMMRVILLVVVVIVFSNLFGKSTQTRSDGTGAFSISKFMPWFVIAFLLLVFLNSIFKIPSQITEMSKLITSLFGVMNLAAIGLSIKIDLIKKSGIKFLSYGFVVGVFQIILAILLIKFIF